MRPVSLEALEERAELLRRVDRKYLVDRERFGALLDALRSDHDVLEIDGRREFAYRTVYFDSGDLRCYHEHVADRRPRFKLRVRLYEDTGVSHFEVKLKGGDGQTDKRQAEHPADKPGKFLERDRALMLEALGDAGVEPLEDPRPVLVTCFHRLTLAARDTPARVTCDAGVRLERPDGAHLELDAGLVLVETKSEDGESRADTALADMGVSEVTLSKYRTGIALLVEGDPTGEVAPLRRYFV